MRNYETIKYIFLPEGNSVSIRLAKKEGKRKSWCQPCQLEIDPGDNYVVIESGAAYVNLCLDCAAKIGKLMQNVDNKGKAKAVAKKVLREL